MTHTESRFEMREAGNPVSEGWQDRLVEELLARSLVREDAARAAMREFRVTGDSVGACAPSRLGFW